MNKSEFRKRVGANIRKYRLQNEFTQEYLAWRAKLTNEYISRVERGVDNISIDSLLSIAKVLDVEPYQFLVGSNLREK